MLFRQLLHESLAAASYLIGCIGSGEAVVVDPSLPAEQYALLAADKGLRVVGVLETHMHADYISNGRALAALVDAPIYAPRLGDVTFPHQSIDDGWELTVGNVHLRALHTPGHTPEHMAYVVTDRSRAAQPWCVLTGDCLFVGDVGRADLVDLPMSGAEYLFGSVMRLLELPVETEIFPGHFGGSACGGPGMSGKPSSSIGFERRFNPFAAVHDLAAFRALLDSTLRDDVNDVLLHRNTNRGVLPLPAGYGAVATTSTVPALGVTEASIALDHGATLIDLRDRMAFAANHPAGALNVAYSRSTLAERIEALTAADEPLVVIAEQPFLARYAAELLQALKRNPVKAFVAASTKDWQQAGLPTTTLQTISVDDLAAEVQAGTALILDVRAHHEQAAGTIAGSQLLPFDQLRSGIAMMPAHRPVIVVCESGTRAVAAASLLLHQGWQQVSAVAPQGVSAYLKRQEEV